MYEYLILNEREYEILGYASSEPEARKRAEKEAEKAGTHRIAVAKRVGTFESVRVWK